LAPLQAPCALLLAVPCAPRDPNMVHGASSAEERAFRSVGRFRFVASGGFDVIAQQAHPWQLCPGLPTAFMTLTQSIYRYVDYFWHK
jgi:hypothetical protein